MKILGKNARRLLSVLLTSAMVLSLVPVNGLTLTAYAEESDKKLSDAQSPNPEDDQPELSMETVEEACIPDAGDLPDGDELFAGYVMREFYGMDGIVALGDYGESSGILTDTEKVVYSELKTLIESVAAGGTGSTQISISTDLGISWTTTKTGDDLKEEVAAKLTEAADMKKIISCLMVDCPYEFYWYDKTAGYRFGYRYGTSVSGGITTASISDLTVYFHVADAYAGSGEYTADTAKTGAASVSAENAQAIVAKYAGLSDYEKLCAYRNEICKLVSYNDDAASDSYTGGYGDPWQLIYVFDNDESTNVVCEGYSKAFQYLCDLSDFKDSTFGCYTVNGVMGGGTGAGRHMWNVVTLGGANYLVDVTNSDTGTVGQNGGLFLAGSGTGSISEGYSFKIGTQTIIFAYDDEMNSLYGDSILMLAGEDYTPGEENISHLTITADKTEITYGYSKEEAPVLTAEVTAGTGGTITYQWYEVIEGGTDSAVIGGNTAVLAIPAGKSAGDHTYYCAATSGGDTIKSGIVTVTVSPKEITANINGTTTKVYDGTIAAPDGLSVDLSGVLSGDDVTAMAESFTYDSADAGENKTITANNITLNGAAKGNYRLSGNTATVSGSITKSQPEIVFNGYPESIVYSGLAPAEPTAEQMRISGAGYGDVKFVWNTADSKAPVNVGEYTLTAVIDKTSNTAKAEAGMTVTIEPKKVTALVELSENRYDYDGTAKEPAVTVRDGDTVIGSGEYTVKYSNNISVGTATVTIEDKTGGNYIVSGMADFEITKPSLENAEVTFDENVPENGYVYDGTSHQPDVIVTLGGKTIPASEYNVSYSNSNGGEGNTVNAGTVTVTVTAKTDGNYYGSNSADFSIAKAGPELSVSPEKVDKVYGDSDFKLTVSRKGDGAVSYASDRESVAAVDRNGNVTLKGAGDAALTVTLTETDNYMGGEVVVTVTVERKNAVLTVTELIYDLTYGDGDFTIGYTSEGESAVTFASSNEKAATVNEKGTVHVVGAGSTIITLDMAQSANYNAISRDVTVNVAAKPLTVTADNKTKTYGDKDPELTYNVSGLVDGDFLSGSLARGTGENVGEYTITQGTLSADSNYVLSFVGAKFTIETADQDAPALTAEDETIFGRADGKIEGLTTAMEYRRAGESIYTQVRDTDMTFKAGTYYVRYAGDGNRNASPDTAVTISAGRMLAVTFVADGRVLAVKELEWDSELKEIPDIPEKTGCDQTAPYWDIRDFTHIVNDMTVTAVYTVNTYSVTLPSGSTGFTVSTEQSTTVEYGRSFMFTVNVADGYSKTDSFAVRVNGSAVTLSETGSYTITDMCENKTITVEGVGDITAPDAEVKVGANRWDSFLNTISFGLFFKETQTVEITASDYGSGVNTVEYYLAAEPVSEDKVKAVTEWTAYSGKLSIDKDNQYIVYVKVTDNAGNMTYISSDGMILESVPPVITGIENGGTYYSGAAFGVNDDHLDTVTVDGAAVTLTEGFYTIPADNGVHTITAADKAGNTITYTITVYRSYTITFVADGRIVDKKSVNYGFDLKATEFPAVPAKAGCDKIAPCWNMGSLTNVTEDRTIEAVYFTNQAEEIMISDTDDGGKRKLVVEPGLAEVSGGLKEIERLNTPEKLAAELKTVITSVNEAVSESSTLIYDVVLMVNMGDGWIKADTANFPENGKLSVILPYPEGTGRDTHDFTVVHMFTGSDFGMTAGNTETPAVTKTDEGILFEVTGLSPIIVGWTEVSDEADEADTDTPSADNTTGNVYTQSTKTGDNNNMWLWLAVLFVSCTGLIKIVIYRKKEYRK